MVFGVVTLTVIRSASRRVFHLKEGVSRFAYGYNHYGLVVSLATVVGIIYTATLQD